MRMLHMLVALKLIVYSSMVAMQESVMDAYEHIRKLQSRFSIARKRHSSIAPKAGKRQDFVRR